MTEKQSDTGRVEAVARALSPRAWAEADRQIAAGKVLTSPLLDTIHRSQREAHTAITAYKDWLLMRGWKAVPRDFSGCPDDLKDIPMLIGREVNEHDWATLWDTAPSLEEVDR